MTGRGGWAMDLGQKYPTCTDPPIVLQQPRANPATRGTWESYLLLKYVCLILLMMICAGTSSCPRKCQQPAGMPTEKLARRVKWRPMWGCRGCLLTQRDTTVSGWPLSPPWDLCGSPYKGMDHFCSQHHLVLPPGTMIPQPQGLS